MNDRVNWLRFSIAIILTIMGYVAAHAQELQLETQQWNHGAANCAENKDPLIQVVRYNQNTWILRQNKCIHYEAPFIFLFVGTKMALLVDTGATGDESAFPLYSTVDNLLSQYNPSSALSMMVIHTHAHGDHRAADAQFRGKPRVNLTGLTVDDVKSFSGISNWPDEQGQIDLGDRVVDIIPIPGHQMASIALYDRNTSLLLTGDTFYPGRLYVDDWDSFRKSIARLTDFVHKHKISYILGNHIEMSTTSGVDYPTGSKYQPQEHALPLSVDDLELLNKGLIAMGDKPSRKVFDKFIVVPK